MKNMGWAQLLENLTVVIRMKGFGKRSQTQKLENKMLFRVVEENFKCL